MKRLVVAALVLGSALLVGISAQSKGPLPLHEPVVPADVAAWSGTVEYEKAKLSDPAGATAFLASLTPAERQGAFLYMQRCYVCHYSMHEPAVPYAPQLSKKNVEGREAAVKTKILEGSQLMPAFKYGLTSEEVDLIVNYLKKRPS